MADQRDTGISWTDETWNPVVGCSIVSPACTNCYAMSMASRIERMAPAQGRETHYAGTTKVVNGKPVWTGKLARAPDHIVTAPLRWTRARRIFVNSMSDLFHHDLPDEWIDEVFAVMALAPQHTFQILTKRPERMRTYLTRDWASAARFHVESLTLPTVSKNAGDAQERLRRYTSRGVPHPLENVWLGVTAEDQARADERIPPLLSTPAAVRFVSAEPLLGPIDLPAAGMKWNGRLDRETGERRFLDWVIVGGESGPGARPMHPDWARSLRDQCYAAGVPFFFKQWGDWFPYAERDAAGNVNVVNKGERPGLFHEWSNGVFSVRLGKKAAGRFLDGVTHDATPAANGVRVPAR